MLNCKKQCILFVRKILELIRENKIMRQEFFSNERLQYLIHGPPKYYLFLILGVLIIYQLFFYTGYSSDLDARLSLRNKIFSISKRSLEDNQIVITISGDVYYWPALISRLQGQYNKPLLNISKIWKKSDLNYVSLDGPVTKANNSIGCTFYEKTKRCCEESCMHKNSEKVISALKEAGADVLGIENENMIKYGAKGLRETILNIQKNKLHYAGAGRNPVFEVNGCNIGFYSYNWAFRHPRTYNKIVNKMKNDLDRSKADIKIIIIHGGNHTGDLPTSITRRFAHFAVTKGASVVVGTHSKGVMGSEKFKGRMIHYGIGSLTNPFDGKNKHLQFGVVQLEVKECKNIVSKPIRGVRSQSGLKVKINHKTKTQ
jgi:poly-gamma-glutamate capsule biosynthesis protein CapA/YwtB (metallophosphatase superfamily)